MNRISIRAGCWVPFVVLLACVGSVTAEVRLPAVFGDHMVLQRGLAAPVWGWADAGEEVSVRFGTQTKKATADATGAWSTRLDPLKASAEGSPLEVTLEVTGGNKIVINDVLVGDVWICSGQSNMEWSVSQSRNGAEEIKSADHPTIRLFDVPGHTTSALPLTGGNGKWALCTPKSVPRFSAVGFFFGRTLLQQGVPIGLIGTNWGGTRIEPWTPAGGIPQRA